MIQLIVKSISNDSHLSNCVTMTLCFSKIWQQLIAFSEFWLRFVVTFADFVEHVGFGAVRMSANRVSLVPRCKMSIFLRKWASIQVRTSPPTYVALAWHLTIVISGFFSHSILKHKLGDVIRVDMWSLLGMYTNVYHVFSTCVVRRYRRCKRLVLKHFWDTLGPLGKAHE